MSVDKQYQGENSTWKTNPFELEFVSTTEGAEN